MLKISKERRAGISEGGRDRNPHRGTWLLTFRYSRWVVDSGMCIKSQASSQTNKQVRTKRAGQGTSDDSVSVVRSQLSDRKSPAAIRTFS